MEEEEAACLHAFQYMNSYMVSMALHTAIELDVFGIIARAGPGAHLSAQEIASQMTISSSESDHQPGNGRMVLRSRLDGILRLLVTHAFLTCSLRNAEGGQVERAYGIAPAAKFFMASPCQGSLAPRLALILHPSNMELCSRMKEAITEGGNQFEKFYSMSIYQKFGADKKYGMLFNESMVGISTITMRKILEVYKGFEGLKSIVDVGGGSGMVMSIIVSKYPSIKAINFDLPQVIKYAPPYKGVEYVEGDMFVSVPKGDSILIKDIFHNWSDEQCLKLLKNCYDALPEKGKIIVITMRQKELPDSNPSSRYVAETDLIMQLKFLGYERNQKQLEALFKASGFSSVRVACSAYDIWDVVDVLK